MLTELELFTATTDTLQSSSRAQCTAIYKTHLNVSWTRCSQFATRHAMTVAMILGLSACAPATLAIAQPTDPSQAIGPSVADSDSPHYRFERFTISSTDGKRVWRIHVGIPKAIPPAAGYPSVWMLDGNASLIEFDDALLEELAAQPVPQVLVFLGHDNDLRIDSKARYRDYTPALLPLELNPEQADDLTGGADAFLDIIERRVRPELANRVKLDPERQAIWGHSLGGLLVLHTLFTRTGAFQIYVAGSPSMWWGNGFAAKEAEQLAAHNAGHPARVQIHLGEAERKGDYGPRDLSNPRVRAHVERLKGAPPDAAMQLATRLKEVSGLDVTYREFPTLGHGPMFRASLMAALHSIAGVADRSDTPRRGASSR